MLTPALKASVPQRSLKLRRLPEECPAIQRFAQIAYTRHFSA